MIFTSLCWPEREYNSLARVIGRQQLIQVLIPRIPRRYNCPPSRADNIPQPSKSPGRRGYRRNPQQDTEQSRSAWQTRQPQNLRKDQQGR